MLPPPSVAAPSQDDGTSPPSRAAGPGAQPANPTAPSVAALARVLRVQAAAETMAESAEAGAEALHPEALCAAAPGRRVLVQASVLQPATHSDVRRNCIGADV